MCSVDIEFVNADQMYSYKLPDGNTEISNWNETLGSLATLLSKDLKNISVQACDQDWKDYNKVQSFLLDVLADSTSRTFLAPLWAQPFLASLICELEYQDGTRTLWIVGADRWTSFFIDDMGNPIFATHTEIAQRYPVERGNG